MDSSLPTSSFLIVSALLLPLVSTWQFLVNRILPAPYLDEVFHVGQALAYWRGEWKTWDPKITTPPFLYIFSYIINGIAKLFYWKFEPGTKALRAGNAFFLAVDTPFRLISLLKHLRKGQNRSEEDYAVDIHTALNVCLFPVLFFFSGLYYTDVLSACVVIETYGYYCDQRNKLGGVKGTLPVVVAGLIALATRQTNIFWVAVFLGGLEVVDCFPKAPSEQNRNPLAIFEAAWGPGIVYDPSITGSQIEDVFLFAISISLATVKDACRLVSRHRVIVRLGPFILLLGAFGAFVSWNGAVVLGDRANHVASLHLPQMLYIWPYIFFFSWPLILPFILNAIIPSTYLPVYSRLEQTRSWLPRLRTTLAILLAMFAAVHWNTIVHPFTLADNRHYVFYVFRILLRRPWIKYAVVPAYFVCGWACIITLAGPTPVKQETHSASKDVEGKGPGGPSRQESPPKLSFLLVWLVSTTLSVITAPLVEPRYFIIPWIIWRIHLPTIPLGKKSGTVCLRWLPHNDYRLYIETLWYLAVNVVTGYMFLQRGFTWPQEPGKVQRFMW